MTDQPSFNAAGRLYIAAVVAAGFAVVLHSLLRLYAAPVGYTWFLLAGLTLLSGSFTVKVPTIPARLSVSEAFVFAAVLLFGPAAATMVVALDSLIISFWIFRTSKRTVRLLFSVSAPPVAIWVASEVFFQLEQLTPLAAAPTAILPLVLPLLALAVLYFLLNSWMVAFAVGLEQRTSPFEVWRRNFLWLSLNYFSGASVAALLLPYLQGTDEVALLRLIGILLPLLLISYLTFKTALGRVDDANRHLVELNRLYLSTIETLAMAIDAKDQITHGHIRRVQILAVGLARAMGVDEPAQIKAIEAAALLHDMGKLAVPEYILNKPGPLTPAEFEKMKLHASVGADILSAIDFPYPVVPIVRHHHESWDGTGYPDGLAASDIPIGARILSVVDCFDALTSDRPYRPRLSDVDALQILADRRGRMYDPLIVDVFSRVYREIAPSTEEITPPRSHFAALTAGRPSPNHSLHPTSRLDDISASTEEMILLYELARGLAGRLELSDAADIITKHLRRIVPATTCAFFVYDVDADDLVAAHATGENAAHFSELRIQMGQRLTGWVAAHRRTIVNSDPTLDLGEVARALKTPLRSCLSTPLLANDDLVGVLTVYSTHRDAFTEDHKRIVEVVSKQVSETVRQALILKKEHAETLRDRVTGLPNRDQLERLARIELPQYGSSFSLITVEIRCSGDVESSELPDPVVARVAKGMRAALGAADLIFRYAPGRFVVLLPNTDLDGAVSRLRVIREHASGSLGDPHSTLRASIHIAVATAPADGTSITELLTTADERLSSGSGDSGAQVH